MFNCDAFISYKKSHISQHFRGNRLEKIPKGIAYFVVVSNALSRI